MIRIRLVRDYNISNKPNMGETYPLVYIQGSNLAECMGNECTNQYHIYENGKLFGNLKSYPNLKDSEIGKQVGELDLSKIVKVGLFKVTKIILWGKGNQSFSLHGEPILFDKILCDDETDKWQKDLDSIIQKYRWSKCIEEEKQYLEANKKEKLRIEKEGWDSLKPLNKDNHPPNMDYPPNIWNNIPLELSKNNKTDYKYILLQAKNYFWSGNEYYFKKSKYETSDIYESPVIAAYNYALWKIKIKQIKEKEQEMNEKYSNKRYIYCPFEEMDECKFNG